MRFRVERVLKYSDAAHDVDILFVQRFYERFHVARSALIGNIRRKGRIFCRERDTTRVIFDINDDGVQLGLINELR